MNTYDAAVIGAGAAGSLAAIHLGELKKSTVLIERNNRVGEKILLTGKGRCNLTNNASLEDFIAKFGKNGAFLRQAFHAFFNQELIDFFKSYGLQLKVERQGRVFPVTDKAVSVVDALNSALLKNKVKILFGSRLKDIKKQGGIFQLDINDRPAVFSSKVILASGGLSYPQTGSTGDGYRIAEELGHSITTLRPALVALRTKELSVCKSLQGLTLKNVRLKFHAGSKKIITPIGELLFTHFGVSGPLVLDYSGEVISLLNKEKGVSLCIDLKPGLSQTQIESRLDKEIQSYGNKQAKNFLKAWLPLRMVEVFTKMNRIAPEKNVNQITKSQRQVLINTLKSFPLTITGALPVDKAMVTSGGIPTSEIDPRTMESKLIKGLYFAGEIIDTHAPSGGYNLQQAFSTGYLAAQSAAS